MDRADRSTDHNANACRVKQLWTINELNDQIVADLKAEMKRHQLRLKGKKAELQERLRTHYRQHHVERSDSQ